MAIRSSVPTHANNDMNTILSHRVCLRVSPLFLWGMSMSIISFIIMVVVVHGLLVLVLASVFVELKGGNVHTNGESETCVDLI